MADPLDSLANSFQCLSLSARDPVVWSLPNIHRDDIHGLILTGDNHIVSGSKDGSIVKSSRDGRIVARQDPSDGKIDYTKWLTAISILDHDTWLEGRRDGCVYVRGNDLKIQRTWTVIPQRAHVSKERNLSRIMSFGIPLASSQNQPFFIGQATEFSVFHKDGQEQGKYSASLNDWVYVLHPLSNVRMLVVTGSNLALWQKQNRWRQVSFIVFDKSRFLDGNRPYISSLVPTTANTFHIAYTVFDGSLRIVDLETSQQITSWHEHRKRVWSVVNCCNSLLASSADDKTVKLWDVRDKKSIVTFNGHSGRVSSLLSLDTSLVCSTCPDHPNDIQGATLICRDVRGF